MQDFTTVHVCDLFVLNVDLRARRPPFMSPALPKKCSHPGGGLLTLLNHTHGSKGGGRPDVLHL